MALRKCPKCELNYIRDEASYCDVCARTMKRVAAKRIHEDEEELEEELICTECGEAPAVTGHELCHDCLKEQKRQQELENAEDVSDMDDDEPDEPDEDA